MLLECLYNYATMCFEHTRILMKNMPEYMLACFFNNKFNFTSFLEFLLLCLAILWLGFRSWGFDHYGESSLETVPNCCRLIVQDTR